MGKLKPSSQPATRKYSDSISRALRCLLSAVLLITVHAACAQPAPQYNYFRTGSQHDAMTKPQPGFALMGGGTDLDEAFRWLCNRAQGGDFLILRATGTDAYNPYVAGLENQSECKLNSVATLVLPNRVAANDSFVATTIARAEAIFISGGDQANYIRYWTNTPVQKEINAAIQRGVPVGGTSAGLAVLSEWVFSAEDDKPDEPNLDGATALANPFTPRVTLVHEFLTIPAMKGIITDTHFAKRDRMGRLLTFLARLNDDPRKGKIRGIGIEERVSVLLEPDGQAMVVGQGSAYLVELTKHPTGFLPGKPLTGAAYSVRKISSGKSLNMTSWDTPFHDAIPYKLTIEAGKIHSTQANGAVY